MASRRSRAQAAEGQQAYSRGIAERKRERQAEKELVWGRNGEKPGGPRGPKKVKVITNPGTIPMMGTAEHPQRGRHQKQKATKSMSLPLQDRLQARQGQAVFAGDQPKAKPKPKRRCAADVGSGERYRDAVAKQSKRSPPPRSSPPRSPPRRSRSPPQPSPTPSPVPRRKKKRKKTKEGASAAAAIDLVSEGEEEPPLTRSAVAAAAPRATITADARSAPPSGDRRRFDAGAVFYSAGGGKVEFTKSADWRLVFKRSELTLERKSNAAAEGCLVRLSSKMVSQCRINATPRAWLHVNVATNVRERVTLGLGLAEGALGADAFGNVALRVYAAPGERCESVAWVDDIRAAAEVGKFNFPISNAATDDGDDSEKPYVAALRRSTSACASYAGVVGAPLRTTPEQARRLSAARDEFAASAPSATRAQPRREDTSSDGALARAYGEEERKRIAAAAKATRRDAAVARRFQAEEDEQRSAAAARRADAASSSRGALLISFVCTILVAHLLFCLTLFFCLHYSFVSNVSKYPTRAVMRRLRGVFRKRHR